MATQLARPVLGLVRASESSASRIVMTGISQGRDVSRMCGIIKLKYVTSSRRNADKSLSFSGAHAKKMPSIATRAFFIDVEELVTALHIKNHAGCVGQPHQSDDPMPSSVSVDHKAVSVKCSYIRLHCERKVIGIC